MPTRGGPAIVFRYFDQDGHLLYDKFRPIGDRKVFWRVPRGRPVWEKAGARLEALLAESPQWTGGKQRLTATHKCDQSNNQSQAGQNDPPAVFGQTTE